MQVEQVYYESCIGRIQGSNNSLVQANPLVQRGIVHSVNLRIPGYLFRVLYGIDRGADAFAHDIFMLDDTLVVFELLSRPQGAQDW